MKRLKPVFGPNYKMDVIKKDNGEVVGYIRGKYEGDTVDVLKADTKKELEVMFKKWLDGYSPFPKSHSPRLEDYNKDKVNEIMDIVLENIEIDIEGKGPNAHGIPYIYNRDEVAKLIKNVINE